MNQNKRKNKDEGEDEDGDEGGENAWMEEFKDEAQLLQNRIRLLLVRVHVHVVPRVAP